MHNELCACVYASSGVCVTVCMWGGCLYAVGLYIVRICVGCVCEHYMS